MTRLKVEENKKVRRSAVDLLDAGLHLLAEHSIQQLTIDALCKQLDVTKGSFYHHFKGRDDYLERMLEHWVEEWTIGSMQHVSATSVSAAERFDAIVDKSNDLPHGPETSIRAWAQIDPLARSYLEKVDSTRMNYLYEMFNEVSGDHDRALLLSRISYSLFVGTRMVAPAILGEERDAIIKLMKNELYGM
ncbi:transcriptional regulator, TetR family [Maridesulfovibrio ferrireducens]|uniref:Transcriptional regulator, TetR family n=1 Tax=Maridesulfovibrio ferrireducens TaxID=246191 RepID=A0A1G9HGV9_9BACT|nr:TetR/AcrR family transcriptional regulator [Maridesulfovibrio ferrireducens]SDL12238.1 transcriptional regulator, TetR family [Maridesulfovibrio ferrireducens]